MPRAPRNPRHKLHLIIFAILAPLALVNAIYLFWHDDKAMGIVFIFCTILLGLALRQVMIASRDAGQEQKAAQNKTSVKEGEE